MKRILSALPCIIIALTSAVAFPSTVSFIEDYDAIENASISIIYLETDDDYNDEFYTAGSGFVAFNNQTFVTNYHVIEDAIWIHAYDENNQEYRVGELLAVDKERDIAILSFESSTILKPLPLAINTDLKRGQPVATIGYPKGLYNTFSTGIISAISNFEDEKQIQFTAPIFHGSSGGALFNEKGEVIGITTSIIEDGQNINSAIDISHVFDLYIRYHPDYLPNKISATSTQWQAIKPSKAPYIQGESNLIPLSLYDEGKRVQNFQNRLKDLGYYLNNINSVYEKSTFDAIKLFQEINGLPITGVVNIETLETIFSEKALGIYNWNGVIVVTGPQSESTIKPTVFPAKSISKAT